VRLADDEVKLALALYYDSAWVQAILGSASLPEAAERVALSLTDSERGPFVVVTRRGHFVTCLARDMTPGQLPVVARDRLTASAVTVDRERKRAALDERVQRGDERLRTLLKRLFFSADSISREDFLEVRPSTLQPSPRSSRPNASTFLAPPSTSCGSLGSRTTRGRCSTR
jgi:hypothetical protein